MSAKRDRVTNDIGQFTIVPLWVLERLRGEYLAQAVYNWLGARYANQQGHAWPRREVLAKDLGCTVKTIERAIELLRQRGVLRTTRRYDPKTGWVTGLDYELITAKAYSPVPDSQNDTTVVQDAHPQNDTRVAQDNRQNDMGVAQEGQNDMGVAQDRPKRHQSRSGQSDTRVAAEPDPVRTNTTPLTPLAGGLKITKRDIRDAEAVLSRAWGGRCPHEPRCANHHACATRIAFDKRYEQADTASRLLAEVTGVSH